MLTGAILAGGKNDRINGQLKSMLTVSGHSILTRQIDLMKKICDDILIVTNEPLNYLPYVPNDVRIITDYYKGYGPLGGIHAALSLSTTKYVWITACDMPFLSLKAASFMYNVLRKTDFDAVIPVDDDKKHYLNALYNKKSTPLLTKVINERSHDIDRFLKKIMWVEVKQDTFTTKGIDPHFLYDIDTQYDYLVAQHYDEEDGLIKS